MSLSAGALTAAYVTVLPVAAPVPRSTLLSSFFSDDSFFEDSFLEDDFFDSSVVDFDSEDDETDDTFEVVTETDDSFLLCCFAEPANEATTAQITAMIAITATPIKIFGII